jgi:hypothetical protein
VDALYAHALRMIDAPEADWPDLAVFLGDQVYADDASPRTRERVRQRRAAEGGEESDLPADHVQGFEEYCWLYHEAWSPEVERWFFSVVPSVMIFDDHDVIDDWNISESWVRSIRSQHWWAEHIRSALMTYWLYQHLGNLSPEDIRSEGMLEELSTAEDATAVLRAWADRAERTAGAVGSYRFSHVRDLGAVRLVMIDVRHARVTTPGKRRIIAEHDWEWVAQQCRRPVDHLLIGSSLPVFVPGGLHDLQIWIEAVANGRWGHAAARTAEWIRRTIDLEDWPSFAASFDAFVDLLVEVGGQPAGAAPRSISVLSGDIHLSYSARLRFSGRGPVTSAVHQLVNSPIRNALTPAERFALRSAMSRPAIGVARTVRRSVCSGRPSVRWRMDQGPIFDNCVGQLVFDGASAQLVQEQACPSDDGSARLQRLYEVDLTPESGGAAPRRRPAIVARVAERVPARLRKHAQTVRALRHRDLRDERARDGVERVDDVVEPPRDPEGAPVGGDAAHVR